LFSFWGVDALELDAVLRVGVIEDSDGVAIGHLDDLARKNLRSKGLLLGDLRLGSS
jgi:hypothetical protein